MSRRPRSADNAPPHHTGNEQKQKQERAEDEHDDQFVAEDDEEEWEEFEDEEGGNDEPHDPFASDDDNDGNNNDVDDKKIKQHDGPSLYEVLGVERDAAPEDIARAYRRQSLRVHPDRNPGNPECTVLFQRLAAAYEVLSDPARRKVYDRTGETSDGAAAGVSSDEAQRSYEVGDMLRTFMSEFKHSEEELQDLRDAFVAGKGNLPSVLDNFMWTNDDGEILRIVRLVNQHVLPAYTTAAAGADSDGKKKMAAAWTKSTTPDKVSALSKKLDKEREQAAEMLREMMENNNTRKAAKDSNAGSKAKRQAAAITDGKKKPKKSNKAGDDDDAEYGDLAALAAKMGGGGGGQLQLPSLGMMRTNAKANYESMTDSLAAKYGGEEKKKKKKKEK